MKTARRFLLALAALALLAGCNAGPDFAPPDPGLPKSSFSAEEARGAAPSLAPPSPTWWKAFRDPVLTELEARVASDNLDVKTATIRLAESRFQRGVAASAQLPSINADAKYQYELYSQNGIASLLSELSPSSSSSSSTTIPAISDYTVGFDASWELDLWGHVRRAVESADAQVEQSAETRRDALVSSLAELARDYVQLRGAQTQIRIAEANTRTARDIEKLAEERQRKGVATGFDAQTAAAQLESVRARIPELSSQESQYANAIGFLLDRPPGSLRAELAARKT
ncbi:MAG: TolC family protein, partial [Methylocystis sp.]